MEVVFTKDVPSQGRTGEVRRVADGYARNYLIPQGLAARATPEVLKRLHKIKAAGDETRVRETGVMQELADALNGASIVVSARVTPTGRYYGTITSAQIATALSTAIGRDIDRRLVESSDVIREPGEYQVVLRLAHDLQATINIAAGVEE